MTLTQHLPGCHPGLERPADEVAALGVRREREQPLRSDGRILLCIPVEARERDVDGIDLATGSVRS